MLKVCTGLADTAQKLRTKHAEKQRRRALCDIDFFKYNQKVNPGIDIKKLARYYPQMVLLVRNGHCTDDKMFAIVAGMSLWDKSELIECNGLWYVSKELMDKTFSVQNGLYIKEGYSSTYCVNSCRLDGDMDDYMLPIFVGSVHSYRSNVIRDDIGEVGIYFEFSGCVS